MTFKLGEYGWNKDDIFDEDYENGNVQEFIEWEEA